MLGNIFRLLAVAVLLLATMPFSSFAQNCCVVQEDREGKFISSWIGVQAPDLGPNGVDRINGPKIKLEDYRGKRILLYSFDTGNFVNGPSEEEQEAIFQLLYKTIDLRNELGRENFEVIGFTGGLEMFYSFPENEIPEDFKAHIKRWKEILLVDLVPREWVNLCN